MIDPITLITLICAIGSGIYSLILHIKKSKCKMSNCCYFEMTEQAQQKEVRKLNHNKKKDASSSYQFC